MKPTKKYALRFFDTFCHQILQDGHLTNNFASDEWAARLQHEHRKCRIAIKKAVLSTARKDALERFLRQNHQEARYLLDLLLARQHENSDWSVRHSELLAQLIHALSDICQYLETSQGQLLLGEGGKPLSNLSQVLQEISESYQQVAPLLPEGKLSEQLTKHIRRFISGKRLRFERNKNSVDYMRSLLRSMKSWEWDNHAEGFSAIERLLIYYNFNTKAVMDILVKGLQEALANCSSAQEKLLLLLERMRSFRQLHRKPGFCLNATCRSIDDFLNQWLESELQFLRAQLNGSAVGDPPIGSPVNKERPRKILCNLSVDQLGILLRAADETKLIEARSLSRVFEVIVPFLATAQKEDISAASMRVKSYHPENRDKALVVKNLRLLISKVESY